MSGVVIYANGQRFTRARVCLWCDSPHVVLMLNQDVWACLACGKVTTTEQIFNDAANHKPVVLK